jgi:hypothetical protein
MWLDGYDEAALPHELSGHLGRRLLPWQAAAMAGQVNEVHGRPWLV